MKLRIILLLYLSIAASYCFGQQVPLPKIVLQRSAVDSSASNMNMLEKYRYLRPIYAEREKIGLGAYDNILFIGEKGDTVKIISLKPDTFLEDHALKVNIKNNQRLNRSKQYIGLVNIIKYVDSTKGNGVKYQIKTFDVKGTLLWEKIFSEETGFDHISDDGKYYYLYQYEPEPEYETDALHAFIIVDKKGQVIKRIPDSGYFYFNNRVFSPNGRFLGITHYNGENKNVFFDMSNNKTAILQGELLCTSITNQGILNTASNNGRKEEKININALINGEK